MDAWASVRPSLKLNGGAAIQDPRTDEIGPVSDPKSLQPLFFGSFLRKHHDSFARFTPTGLSKSIEQEGATTTDLGNDQMTEHFRPTLGEQAHGRESNWRQSRLGWVNEVSGSEIEKPGWWENPKGYTIHGRADGQHDRSVFQPSRSGINHHRVYSESHQRGSNTSILNLSQLMLPKQSPQSRTPSVKTPITSMSKRRLTPQLCINPPKSGSGKQDRSLCRSGLDLKKRQPSVTSLCSISHAQPRPSIAVCVPQTEGLPLQLSSTYPTRPTIENHFAESALKAQFPGLQKLLDFTSKYSSEGFVIGEGDSGVPSRLKMRIFSKIDTSHKPQAAGDILNRKDRPRSQVQLKQNKNSMMAGEPRPSNPKRQFLSKPSVNKENLRQASCKSKLVEPLVRDYLEKAGMFEKKQSLLMSQKGMLNQKAYTSVRKALLKKLEAHPTGQPLIPTEDDPEPSVAKLQKVFQASQAPKQHSSSPQFNRKFKG